MKIFKTMHFKEKYVKFLVVIGLIMIATTIFSYTISERKPWFGVYSGENHDWLTASTLIFSDNWYREGAWNLRFGMYNNPASPENTTQLSRSPYLSYPPGAVIPVYMISMLSQHEPSVSMVMRYNLFNHLMITIFLALTIYFFLRSLKLRTGIAFSFALIPILLELFLPSPFYYHQNSFFSDQAVILPFVLVVFLEVLRADASGRRRKVIDILQGLVFCYGVFTDWFFIFIAIVFYLKRLIFGEIGFRDRKEFFHGSLKFAAGPVAGFALFVIHMTIFMWGDLGYAVEWLKVKYLARAGMASSDTKSKWDYYQDILGHINQGYGTAGIIIIFITMLFVVALSVYLLIRKLKARSISSEVLRIAQLAFIIVVPCVLQISVLINHSAVHSFSVLKLSVVVSVVPFVLIPVFLAVMARDLNRKVNFSHAMVVVMIPALLLAGFYLAMVHDGYKEFFRERNAYWYLLATATTRNTKANDIVFSPEMYVSTGPPQPLSLTMKRVYQIKAVDEIGEKIKDTQGDYRVAILFWRKPEPGTYWYSVMLSADSTKQDSEVFCAYFSPESIRKYLDA
ncbi:MAG: hypothetical protein ACYC4D_04305 [Thermoleophilia bacterium]